MQMKDPDIVYMGTPEFAVEPLKALLKAGKKVTAVITAVDKPAGRGKALRESPVKEFALKNNLKVLQPSNLKNPAFLNELRTLHADLQVVVAFRILPEEVWSMPKLGTFNLHASLLPDYRGAAPINWAIINGEKLTGVTTFFIDKDIDTGKIILQEKVKIGDEETAGELHDKLMILGSGVVLRTIELIETGKAIAVDQSQKIPENPLKPAPKIYKKDCRIRWNTQVADIFNFIRGLSPYPGAWTILKDAEGENVSMKIFRAGIVNIKHAVPVGAIESDGKQLLRIAASDGYLDIKALQLAGKTRMSVEDFLRGFQGIMKYWAE